MKSSGSIAMARGTSGQSAASVRFQGVQDRYDDDETSSVMQSFQHRSVKKRLHVLTRTATSAKISLSPSACPTFIYRRYRTLTPPSAPPDESDRHLNQVGSRDPQKELEVMEATLTRSVTLNR